MFLHEEILLLALKEETGRIDWKAGMVQYVMAGALVAELLLEERLAVAEGKKKLVSVLTPARHENAVLEQGLALIRDSKKERNLQHWVTKLGSLKGLRDNTAKGLCRQGVLKEEEGKVLFIFPSKKYPELNPEPEQQLIQRLREAIFAEGEVDIRTALLISLAHPSGILGIPFTRKELRQQKKRIKDITSGEAIGEATGAAIAAVQAAIAVVAVIPAITAASSPPSSPGC